MVTEAPRMTDYFALLQEPRRPSLDPEKVKERFVRLSALAHPDRTHQGTDLERARATDEFARLNTAQQCLRETVPRLRHLLELETGTVPGDVREIPEESMALLVSVAKKCRETDAFLEMTRGLTSPMLKARFFAQGLEWLDELQKLQAALRERQTAVSEQLAQLNPAWDDAPPPGDDARRQALPLDWLEQLYRTSSFLARAGQQIQERAARLGL
jgi:curved DNA-binding protein CbpA